MSPLSRLLYPALLVALSGPLPAATVHRLIQGDLTAEIATETLALEPEFGPRFDTSAVVTQVTKGGRTWLLAPNGLGDEFGLNPSGVVGYDQAKVGEPFLKIGVGVLQRDTDSAYQFYRRYPVIERAATTVQVAPKRLSVKQTIRFGQEFGYEWEKAYTISGASLTVAYVFRNTGSKPLPLEHYNHQWFLLGEKDDPRPLAVLTGDFQLAPALPPKGLEVAPGVVTLNVRPTQRQNAYVTSDVALAAKANRFVLRFPDGAQVQTEGDYPVDRIAVWSDGRALCPEFFRLRTLAPGGREAWQRTYRFVTGR